MLSYWERTSLTNYDFIIIGAGIVGMSTAIEIKNRQPSSSILILERSIFPYGASSRNAGFACVGSISEYLDDLTVMSMNDVHDIFEKRVKGLHLLRQRLGDHHIDYRQNGSYELLTQAETSTLDHIDSFNDFFRDIVRQNTYSVNHDYLPHSRINLEHFTHTIQCHIDGEINTGKMLKSLQKLCLEKGIIIKTGAFVTNHEQTSLEAHVTVTDHSRNECIHFSCNQLIFCTNAFTGQFFNDLDLQPGRGQVLITHPINELKIQGIHHFNKGYYYFREINGRILIGGGRNLDFNGETCTKMEINELIIDDLKYQLKHYLLPHQNYSIDMSWSGIMAFGKNKTPIIKQISPNIWCAVRLGGMGVAIGSIVGQELAEKIFSTTAQ